MTLKRGDKVQYKAGGSIVNAIVRRLHRDGHVTVEATFMGRHRHYLGYRYKLRSDQILGPKLPSPECEDLARAVHEV